MCVSEDAPSLDIAYKLVEYAGRGRLKLSPGKELRPGRKQVFRIEQDGRAVRDVLGLADERQPGRPLLEKVMDGGRRLPAGDADHHQARKRAAAEIARLPERIRALEDADPPYPVEVSTSLERESRRARDHLRGGERD